jgi:hypothetical protein
MENTITLMKYLGVEEITTPKQQINGTREFAIPFYVRGKRVTLASYQTGYVRIDRKCHSRYQINPTYDVPYKVINSDGVLRTWTSRKRIMIYGENNRIDFIFKFILKNYYNKNEWKK